MFPEITEPSLETELVTITAMYSGTVVGGTDLSPGPVVQLWAGDSALTSEGLRRRLAAMRTELSGPDASALEWRRLPAAGGTGRREALARPEGSELAPPTIVIEGVAELVEALWAA